MIAKVKAALSFLVYLRRPDYHRYIQSDAWRKRADECKRRAGYRCQLCNSPDRLEAHHRTYERLGREEPGDLTCLCHRCHQEYHSRKTQP
jgi:5-methylcytosine-specific restriction endonuclease McrA